MAVPEYIEHEVRGEPQIKIMKDRYSERNLAIVRYNLIGTVMNLCLAGLKIIAGRAIHSQAVTLDGINSLSDSAATIVSIVVTIFAGKKVDKDHPLGYGRVEYIGSMLVTFIILYIGAVSMVGAIEGILNKQEPPDYTTAALVLMIISMICKIVYGILMRRKGTAMRSDAMIMTGTDSLGDAVISFGIIAAIFIYDVYGISIENYVCIGISIMIFWTGITMILDCANKLIGTRTDPEIKRALVCRMVRNEEVLNVSNLVIHNYGESMLVGSMDIDVDEEMKAGDVTRLSRNLIDQAAEMDIIISSVGINGISTSDPEFMELWDAVIDMALEHENVIRISGLNLDKEANHLSFYVVQDYSSDDLGSDREKLREELLTRYPDLDIDIYTAIDI